MTMSPDGEVAEALRPVLGETLDRFVAISRAENLDRNAFSPGALLREVRHEEALLCASTPFFDHNTMLPNGDVVLCCMDYSRKHVVGNLFRQGYAELFAGAEMAAIRSRAMGIHDDDLICRRCHNAVGLSQGERTHWQLKQDTMWTNPHEGAAAPSPTAMPRPRQGLRDLVRRLGRL
jgi:hypothetical protein